jgi:hypothetical protein
MLPIRTIAKWTFFSIKFCYRMLAVSAEVFCRHSFGERYVWNLVAGFCFCGFCSLFIGGASPGRFPLFGLYAFAFLVLVCFHIVSIVRRRDGTIQSDWCGVSHSFWTRLTRSPLLVRAAFEPGVIALAGLIVKSLDTTLSGWLLASAICLCIKATIEAWRLRNQVLGVFDSRIESERMNGILDGDSHSGRRDDGSATTVTQAAGQDGDRPSLGQIFARLDPALRQVLSDPTPPVVTNSPDSRKVPTSECPHHAGPLGHLPRITSKRRAGRISDSTDEPQIL